MAKRSLRAAAALALISHALGIELRSAARAQREQRKVEELVQRSANISASLAALGQSSALDPTTRHLLASLRVCGGCDKFKRFGEDFDGGYLTCMDGWEKGGVKAALSMGVEHHDKWSQDMSAVLRSQGDKGTVVHQFDCTVSSGQECPGCAFHRACIAPEKEAHDDYWSMSQVLNNTGLASAPDRSLIMKMDIEAAEWPVLASERPDVLKKFRQVILEFHWLDKEWNHKQYDEAVTALLGAGFRVVHIHGNNYGDMYYVPGTDYAVPNVLEVTFVADARQIKCQGDQTLHPLDRENNDLGPPLPMAHLPAPSA